MAFSSFAMKQQEENPGWKILLLIFSWTSKHVRFQTKTSVPAVLSEYPGYDAKAESAGSWKRKAVLNVLMFSASGLIVLTQCKKSKRWGDERCVQTQGRQPLEKPFGVPADVNTSMFLKTAGCSLSPSALGEHWPYSHRFGLFTWKKGARKRVVLQRAHSMTAQPEE